MEGTVTIPLREYELLADVRKNFDEKLESELKRMNETDRIFVLRDRDEYVRRNESLVKENSEKAEEIRKVSEENVRLRGELDKTKADLGRAEKLCTLAHEGLDAAEGEFKKRDENEKTLRETVVRLREERSELLLQRDALLDRGLLARIFNRRPW